MLGIRPRFFAVSCLFFFAASSIGLRASAAEPELNLLDYDIRDIREFVPERFPLASVLLSSMEREPERYFPKNVTLANVWGLEIQKIWSPSRISVVAFLDYPVRPGVRRRFFRFMTLQLSDSGESIGSLEFGEDVPLAKTHWSIEVGLIQRKVILEENQLHLKKIYPIGVGGFDEGVTSVSLGRTRLNTPLYQNAALQRVRAIAARTQPEYYLGQPFIPITRHDGKRTPFSFHILQSDNDPPTPTDLERGFISHGCMQLRERNLQELYTILRWGAEEQLPISIHYYLSDPEDHPYPLLNDRYATLQNCAASGEKPHPCLDPDLGDLLLLVEVEGKPPIDSLMGIDRERAELQQEKLK